MRLLLLFFLLFAGFCLWVAFDNCARSVSDFEQLRISDYRSYLTGGRYRKIVIESGGKEYSLYPHGELKPEWAEKFSEILPVLASSTEATIWVDDGYSVMGLEIGGRLIISPTQGVKLHQNKRRIILLLAALFFVAAIIIYLSVRKADGLD